MVLLGEHVRDGRIDHVAIDNVEASREATDHLLSIGKRRIAFMGYQPHGPRGTGDLRLEGYRRSLSAVGLKVDPELILTTTTYTREEGEIRARLLVPKIDDIDAIVCANDLLAIGVLRCFRDNNILVPSQVAILGWDNTPDGAYSYPGLTTIAPDLGEIARVAVSSLLTRIDEPERAPTDVIIPHRLIIRASTITES